MQEQRLERRFNRAVIRAGGVPFKLAVPNLKGMPDRMVLSPGGRVVFAEIKAPGKKLRPLQFKRKAQLEALGFKVLVIDSEEGIEEIVEMEVS